MKTKRTRRDLWVIGACLLASGSGSLVLEVVWSRMLKLVFGSTTLAVSTILVAYMLGLGLGGLLGGRIAGRFRNGVRAYGFFEVAIALYAFVVPFLLEALPWLNENLLGDLSFWPKAIVRFGVVLVLLLLPTLLMGATLPILVAALVKRRSDLAEGVGLLYGMNTLGAMLGVVGSTFLLFPRLGLWGTNVFGASLDLSVGLFAALVLWRLVGRAEDEPASTRKARVPKTPSLDDVARLAPPPSRRWNLALISYGLVGFTSLAYEVAWFRALSMITGASVYAFSVMLAAFLSGIALGSISLGRWAGRVRRPALWYAIGLVALGLLAIVTMMSFSRLPDLLVYFFEHYGVSGSNLVFGSMFVSFLAMFAPTFVLGGLFPLLTRAAAAEGEEGSRTVAGVYFVNTLGSAAGAFAGGFLLIPLFGVRASAAICIAINLVTAAIVLLWQHEERGTRIRVVSAALVLVAGALLWAPPFWEPQSMTGGVYYRPDAAIDFGLQLEPYEGLERDRLLFYQDGLNTTVSIHDGEGGLNLRLGGKPDASVGDMSTQTLSAHIPLMFGPPAEDVLVIGYASGVTAGSASLHAGVHVDVVELEPAVLDASRYFDEINYAAQDRDNVTAIVDDGRSYLSSTDKIYDVIISEPSNPWISGASNLFTKEYFNLAREHLTEEGVLLQWIQLYGMDDEGLRSIWRAVRSEFKYVYGFLFNLKDVDFLMLATNQPIDPARMTSWDDVPEEVREDMRRVRVMSQADVLSLLQIMPGEIDELIETGAGPANSDDNMFVELRSPWTIYRDAFENLDVLTQFDSGVAALLGDAGLAKLSSRELGELAHSYVAKRGNHPVAKKLYDLARSGGETGETLALRAYLELEYSPATEEERVRSARTWLDAAVERDPSCYLARAMRGTLRMNTGDPAGALEDLDVAIARRPKDFEIQMMRTRALGSLGRVVEARVAAQSLLDRGLDTFHWKILMDAAPAAASMGQLEVARDMVKRYVSILPHSPREWQLLSTILQDLGNSEGALSARANAERARRNRRVIEHRGALLFELFDNFPRAEQILERLVRDDPSNERARSDLERVRAAQRNAS